MATSTAPSGRIAKTVEIDRDQVEDLQGLWKRTRQPSFSETVRLVIRHGLLVIKQLEAEGKLVA